MILASGIPVEDWGAVGDGRHDDGGAIQRAIDAASGQGGGRVVLAPGKVYLSSPLQLRSRVRLHVGAGTTLRAHWHVHEPSSTLGGGTAFLTIRDAQNVELDGSGVIDGDGESFFEQGTPFNRAGRPKMVRPALIRAIRSQAVTIYGVRLQNSPYWTIHMMGCEDVMIRGVEIRNPLTWANTDGIDLDHSRNVTVDACIIETGDDGVAIKNTSPKHYGALGPSVNIRVTNCQITSASAAIKIGSESLDEFRAITVANCFICGSNRGFGIQLRDGGSIEDVTVDGLYIETRRFEPVWWGSAEPVHLSVRPRLPNGSLGRMRHVLIRNLTCRSENGLFIDGGSFGTIEGIVLENITLDLARRRPWHQNAYDLRPGVERQRQVTHPTGLFVRSVSDLTLRYARFQCRTGQAPWVPVDVQSASSIVWSTVQVEPPL